MPIIKKSFRVPTSIRVAALDVIVMVSFVAAVSLLASLFGGPSIQRVVTSATILMTAVLGLQLFSGNTGIVSFGHSGFIGLSAYVVGILTMPAALQATTLNQLPHFLVGHQLPFVEAFATALLIGVLVGTVTGTSLWRLSGSSASIATLALLIIIYTLLAASRGITRGSQPFYGVPQDVGLWTAGVVGAFSILVARVFRETAFGLGARAAADDERGASAVGVHRGTVRLVSWIISVVVAFAAGAMMAQFLGAFSPKDFYFELGFTMLAMLILGGMNSSIGALAGVAVTTVLVEVVRRAEGGGSVLGMQIPPLFGLTQAVLAVAMITIIWRRPQGLLGNGELNLLSRLGGAKPDPDASVLLADPQRQSNAGRIEARGVSRRYAGIVAVDNISLTFEPNSITGIIGPNGAGKTTFINMISGDVTPSDGEVSIGVPTRAHSAFEFARAGVARSFQNIRVFGRMTVLENVVVAARQVEPNLSLAEAAAWRELNRMGLAEHANRFAEGLAYGMRRRLEIARALVLKPRFLLLDEPAAGMNAVETAALTEILVQVRVDRGIGIILIEHDMRLVMSLCQRIIVIDRGRVIADGQPSEIQQNTAVIAAYLGSRTAKSITAKK